MILAGEFPFFLSCMTDLPLRVRVAVVVDGCGEWSAVGGCAYGSDEEVVQQACRGVSQTGEEARRVVWVEVEVPPPGFAA